MFFLINWVQQEEYSKGFASNETINIDSVFIKTKETQLNLKDILTKLLERNTTEPVEDVMYQLNDRIFSDGSFEPVKYNWYTISLEDIVTDIDDFEENYMWEALEHLTFLEFTLKINKEDENLKVVVEFNRNYEEYDDYPTQLSALYFD